MKVSPIENPNAFSSEAANEEEDDQPTHEIVVVNREVATAVQTQLQQPPKPKMAHFSVWKAETPAQKWRRKLKIQFAD